MSLFQCLILKKVEWRHAFFFSFDVNDSSPHHIKKSEKFLENNVVRVATLT